MPTCPSCGHELPGEFPFCPFCRAALTEAPRGRGREERKVVTVVFADLVGFTARSERLDPEDVRALLARYHGRLRAELERFGGTVEKFIGDAVMAVFGAPVAHEDDPERAVRAALAIREWAIEQGDDLQVRVAVNGGEALVTLDARAAEGEAMVAGDVVNAAARLQAAAPLNGVLVGTQTHRATAEIFDYREVAPVVAKGKAEPVPAWEALRARSRFGVDVTRRASTPLVGRERELELLVSTLARVREERAAQLVTLVGVPGIGKSRLVLELSRTVDDEPGLVAWRQGRSLPYGDGVTFWALAEIVKAQAGMLESDDAAQAGAKLRQAVAAVAADAGEAVWLERHLKPLAGLGEDGGSSFDEASAAWRRFLEAVAERRPLVLVLEDLHWADDALLEFVDGLVDRAGQVPLLVLATARPELLQRRPSWGGGKPNASTLSLSPLGDGETAQLVAYVLAGADEQRRSAVLARAGGNPLYAEQYARALAEGDDLDTLPETVQGIVAARIDALPEEEKRLLQDAAVVGKVFWLGAVEAVGGFSRWQADELLHRLERKEFVQRSRGSSVASESEYAFRHLLIRDVAYGQIPRGARAEKHRETARWIESLGRPDDQAELLAHHYLQALELAEAAGADTATLGEPARLALRDAGDRAASLHAPDAATRFYEAALRLWPQDDPERAELLFRRAAPVMTSVGGDVELLAEASEALEAAGRHARAAEAELLLARAVWYRGETEPMGRYQERARRLLTGVAPSRAHVMLLLSRATAAGLGGHSVPQLELAREAYALAGEIGWHQGALEALTVIGTARASLGDERGLEDLARAAEEGAAAGALGVVSRALNNTAVAKEILGDVRGSTDARLQAGAVAERIGSADERRWSLGVLSDHHYRSGKWSDALQVCEEFLTGPRHYLGGEVWMIRAAIRAARGDEAGAVADVELALPYAREIEEPQVRYYLIPFAAYVLARAGALEQAEPLAAEFLDFLSRRPEPGFAIIALASFAEAARALGLDRELASVLADARPSPWIDATRAYALHEYATAADLLDRIGSLPDAAEARTRAAERLAAEGRTGEAHLQLAEALEFYRSVEAVARVRELGLLLPSPSA